MIATVSALQGAGGGQTQPDPAAALVEAEGVKREILPIERVVRERRTETHARHVVFGPRPFRALRIQQELRASGRMFA